MAGCQDVMVVDGWRYVGGWNAVQVVVMASGRARFWTWHFSAIGDTSQIAGRMGKQREMGRELDKSHCLKSLIDTTSPNIYLCLSFC